MIDLSPNPSPKRRGEPDFSPFPCREGGWGVRSVCEVRGCDHKSIKDLTKYWYSLNEILLLSRPDFNSYIS
ncbi:hypothetical protein FD723_10855 [Nostoc sp. C052]|nr:hypothetical protein FD723_10855 [Nostoc sp. C052]